MTPSQAARPRLVHLTTFDLSLTILLGPQLRAFADAGYEVIGMSAPGPAADTLAEWGIDHVPVQHVTRAMAPHRDVRALGELYRIFRRLRPTIVHTHNPKPGVYGRLAARAARIPAVVNTVHGLYALPTDPLGKRALVYGLERVASTCSDAELVQNPEDIPVLRRLRIPEEKIHLLGNGVDLARFDRSRLSSRREATRAGLGIAPSEVVCGAIGRLVREKGYAELFAAAAEVRRTRPNVRFLVVGPEDPDKSDALSAEEIDRARRDAGICFLGMRFDVEDLYTAMDLYVLASHREGFPRSAMEAAAMGLPIIATDIRGCRQVVDAGTSGLLVPVGDPAALAAAIGRLVDDERARASMGAAGAAKAIAEFDQQDVIDTTLRVYDDALARRRVARR